MQIILDCKSDTVAGGMTVAEKLFNPIFIETEQDYESKRATAQFLIVLISIVRAANCIPEGT